MRLGGLLAGALAVTVAVGAAAQTQPSGPPNALQGFSQNRNQPIKIDAATLEVRDKQKTATFSGNVQVVQGDTTLRSRVLVVFYEGDGSKGPSVPQSDAQQRIRRLEAKGNVIVTQKDQIATGDTGIYDMPSNSVTLVGNVVVSQGPNVIKGDRLVVDLTSGISRVESSATSPGRVQGLFLPSSAPRESKTGSQERSEAPGEAPRAKTMHPGLY